MQYADKYKEKSEQSFDESKVALAISLDTFHVMTVKENNIDPPYIEETCSTNQIT
jgi:hypothetical protein